jgi:hypothetical protein
MHSTCTFSLVHNLCWPQNSEEHRLRVLVNRILMIIFIPKKENQREAEKIA